MRLIINGWYLLESMEDYMELRKASERESNDQFNTTFIGSPPEQFPVFAYLHVDQEEWELTAYPYYLNPETVSLMAAAFTDSTNEN